MTERYPRGNIARLYADLIVAGVGQLGKTPVIAIQRLSDSFWYDSDPLVDAFLAPYAENAMVELDAVNLPGKYHFDFDPAKDELGTDDFLVKLVCADPVYLDYRNVSFGPMASVAAPLMCSIQGTLYDAARAPLKNAKVIATVVPVMSDSLGRGFEGDKPIEGYTGVDGFFDLPVIRGATVRLEIRAIGYDHKVLVPDLVSVLFTDL